MKKTVSILLVAMLLLGLSAVAFGEITGDPILIFKGPILITNAGQGPGGKMARLLMGQTKTINLDTDFYYLSEPKPEDMDERPYTCLVCVIGSTDKGLGASGITIDDEIARLEKVVAYAKEIELPIITVLLEKDKRSDIKTNANERCIELIAPASQWMIIVKDGNLDGRFDKIKEEYDIPLTILDTSLDFTILAKEAFLPVQ